MGVNINARFRVGCDVDLKTVAFRARNVEYNPRKHGKLTVRMRAPSAVGMVTATGIVTVTGCRNEEDLKTASRRIAKLVKSCNHPSAVLQGWRVTNLTSTVDTKVPVRLE